MRSGRSQGMTNVLLKCASITVFDGDVEEETCGQAARGSSLAPTPCPTRGHGPVRAGCLRGLRTAAALPLTCGPAR